MPSAISSSTATLATPRRSPAPSAPPAAPRRLPISAALITLNAAETIESTLDAIAWCDEIVVVDSGSGDRTVEICRERGCVVIEKRFTGFGPQKQFAVAAARHDWILAIDADEVVSPELRVELERLLTHTGPGCVGYEIRIPLVFMGRVLRFGGEYQKRHLRLFDRRHGTFNDAQVHERVVVDGRIGRLSGLIWHRSYRDLHHYFEKFNDYTTRSAGQLADRGQRVSRWLVAWRLPLVFLHLYLVRGLILDGFPGFVWAALSSFHRFTKYVKLFELNERKRHAPADLPAPQAESRTPVEAGAAGDAQ